MGVSRNVQLTAAVVLLAAVLSSAASGQGLPRYGVFVYADLCIAPQSGDVAGNRVSLLRYSDADKLIFEYTEGALMAPLFADKMTLDSTTGALSFEVREDGQTVTFRGTVTDDALVGTISDRPEPVRLARVGDFGRKQAKCR
jgi:hypothetical protein